MEERHWQGSLWVSFRVTAAFGLAAFLLLGLPLLVSAAEPSVVINEVMWMGSAGKAADEWIELRNTTADPIDVTGWEIVGAGSGAGSLTLTGLIAGRGFYLLSNYDSGDAFSALADTVAVDQVEPGIVLTNAGEQLALRDANDAIIDATPADDWPTGANASDKQSMQRQDPPGEGSLAASWYACEVVACTSEDFWQASGANFGTPGAANSEPKVNMPPEAVIGGPGEGLTGELLAFTAEDSADPDEDELTYAWSFGDEAAAAGVTATHVYDAAGAYEVTLMVEDSGEATAEAVLTVTVAAPVYSSSLVINEVLPNPVGSDTAGEFIELHNTGSQAVDVAGWQLDDAESGSAPHTIGAGVSIPAGGYRVFPRSETKLALNNTGDSVRLFDPAGGQKGSLVYSGGAEGESYSRTSSGSYAWSETITAGAANVITAPSTDDEEEVGDEEAEAAGQTGSVAGSQAVAVPLADVREEEPGTTVTVTGVVSAPPGTLGTYVMYVAGSGIQVYLSREAWPNLKLGDTVDITGELSSIRGEARLKVAAAADMNVVRSGAPPEPHLMETGEIDEALEGWLVTVQGEVSETSGDTFYVDDGSGAVKIYITASSDIDKPAMKKGTAVTITGVVSETTSGYRILPRFQEDVRLGRVAGLTSFPATGLRPTSWWGFARQAGFLFGWILAPF